MTVRGYGYQEIDEDSGDVKTVPLFEPEYERYKKGETLLDEEGNAIQKTEFVEIFEEETYTQYVENRQIIAATYESGTYSFHVDGTEDRNDTYVVVLPEKADGAGAFKIQGCLWRFLSRFQRQQQGAILRLKLCHTQARRSSCKTEGL